MERKVLDQVCTQIYRQFPEVKGKRPTVRTYAVNKHLLIFNSKATTADGKNIPRTIRVVVSEDGKIDKITTSR